MVTETGRIHPTGIHSCLILVHGYSTSVLLIHNNYSEDKVNFSTIELMSDLQYI